ncbi:hypothetical protein KIN20_030665 [Parelaphostrongylus tenuis]|uniref:Uncharacterized protein n=1 Tax=Parelaphostrongylus tenuis TaxID=148309 RepID=A0AAD5R4G4_PARTN|nr:hypothetical protein KIN20_030665 [Parelaphostrongylus tenuis]
MVTAVKIMQLKRRIAHTCEVTDCIYRAHNYEVFKIHINYERVPWKRFQLNYDRNLVHKHQLNSKLRLYFTYGEHTLHWYVDGCLIIGIKPSRFDCHSIPEPGDYEQCI